MKLLVIDCPALCYRAWHKLGGLSFQGQDTGVIYGFLTQLYSLKNVHRDWSPVFCWDSRASKRREIFPQYKQSRRTQELSEQERRDRDMAYLQFSLLRRTILPSLGFVNNFMFPGYESDDIIAQITSLGPAKKNAIVSSDHDLYQLLTERTWMVNPGTGKSYTDENFMDEWGIPPQDWWRVKAFAGCATDEVPGLSGIGEKTAAKFVAGTLSRGKKYTQLFNCPDTLWERNVALTRLPFRDCPLPVLGCDTYDPAGFEMICEMYGMESLATRAKDWQRMFPS